jgi:hypothetical protein
MRGLRPGPECSREERVGLLLRQEILGRKLEAIRMRGSVETLLAEVNAIYDGGIENDRIRENAKAIHARLLWCAIARRRRKPNSGSR